MIKSSPLTDQTSVVAAQTPLMSELSGEAILLDPTSGIYYGLTSDVGIRIWQLIQKVTTVGSVQSTILSEYDVDAEQCAHDVSSVIQHLIDNNLATICDAIAA